MAINFSQKKKTQKYMILVFIAILLTVFLVIWLGLLKKPQDQISTGAAVDYQIPDKIEINFAVLKHPFLRDSQLFEEIQSFKTGTSSAGTIGRENPFIKY